VREDAVTSAVTPDIFTTIDRLRVRPGTAQVGTSAPAAPKPKKPGKITGEFLKGPVPLSWLSAAAKLRGKAPLAVALAVWFEAGRRRSNEVRLTTAILNRFSVNRKAKYTALTALEKAGLVRIHRQPRKNPIITIIDPPGGSKAGGQERDVTATTPPATDETTG
jgi:hypothetical protein